MTSSNGIVFHVTGPLCGEFTGHRWIPLTKASDAELWCFLWSLLNRLFKHKNCEAGDLRRHRANYDVIVMCMVMYFTHTVHHKDCEHTVWFAIFGTCIAFCTRCLRFVVFACVNAVVFLIDTLRWRHNGRDGISNHQLRDCLLNRLFGRRSKKTSKHRVTGLYVWNSPGTGEFPVQMASNAQNVSIWWRHHVI